MMFDDIGIRHSYHVLDAPLSECVKCAISSAVRCFTEV